MNSNPNRFAEYVKTRKHTPPRLLFKYGSFETARKIIDGESVLFSSPIKFNDPLDTQWNMLWQLSTPEFNKALVEKMLSDDFEVDRVSTDNNRKWIVEERAKYAKLSPNERQVYVAGQIESLDKDIVMRQAFSDQLKRLRVFCLAALPDSVQMWSYYADKHEGVVLAFDSVMLENHWNFPVDKVVYSERLPEVLDQDKYPDAYLDALIYDVDLPEVNHERAAYLWTFSKAKGWEHEQEWRFVHIADRGDTALGVLNRFPMGALVGIALGCKGNRNDFDCLAGSFLKKNPHGSIWLTNPHRGEFALVATPIVTSRWVK